MSRLSRLSAFLLSMVAGSDLLAAEGMPHFVNYYNLLSSQLGLDATRYVPIFGSLFTLILTIVIGLRFKRSTEAVSGDLTPSSKPSLSMLVETALDFVYGLSKEHCGKNYRSYMPLLAGLFLFILFSSLSGLVPGLPPATEDFNTNLAMGAIAFLSYNYAGVKEHGASYAKQFMGPFLILAPLFIGIELVSHSVRPLSLAFRLLANIFCDHLLLGVFSGLVPLVVPSLFLCFGLLVAVIQSFVFTLLTGIYINMAISHDH